jgi:hypothetical protein
MPRDYDGENRRKFHFNREISLGHIIQAVVILGTVIVYANKLEARIVTLEVTKDFTEKAIVEIKDTLKEISRKLDR